MNIQVGDWVRFYLLGSLTISEVRYIKPFEPGHRSQRVCTDCGEYSMDEILEVRREKAPHD